MKENIEQRNRGTEERRTEERRTENGERRTEEQRNVDLRILHKSNILCSFVLLLKSKILCSSVHYSFQISLFGYRISLGECNGTPGIFEPGRGKQVAGNI